MLLFSIGNEGTYDLVLLAFGFITIECRQKTVPIM